ncbi:hypothetical protein LTR95_006698 [Oleoguttula sp. CCFEE 5521]
MSTTRTLSHKRQNTSTNMQVLSSVAMRIQQFEKKPKPGPRDSMSPQIEAFLPRKSSIIAPAKLLTTAPISSPKVEQSTKALPSLPQENPTARGTHVTSSQRRRPSPLHIGTLNGHTTTPIPDLKLAIRSGEAGETKPTTLEQTIPPSPPVGRRRRLRKSPAPPPPLTGTLADSPTMGNQHSHHAVDNSTATDESDAHSISSQARPRSKGVRLPRRSSFNVFKAMETKSPIPPGFTATVIEVPRAATAPNLDDMADEDASEEFEELRGRTRHVHRHSAPSPALLSHPIQPASPATVTERNAARPLSAVDTITTYRPEDEGMGNAQSSSPEADRLRVSALSPTLPSPSPLPEDSPHKYGLRDCMDTPDGEVPPPDIQVAKAKRRSSGLEIFNEARSLQSAASFLNGLSSARRRAESLTQLRNPTDSTSNSQPSASHLQCPSQSHLAASTAHLPSQSTLNVASQSTLCLPSQTPLNDNIDPLLAAAADATQDTLSRALGHSTKSSGYTYARPLRITQLKCYRNHARLLPTSNKYAPVECAVCHSDFEGEGWSCAWCAVRMCGLCRREFGVHGEAGLRGRVKGAEMGWV